VEELTIKGDVKEIMDDMKIDKQIKATWAGLCWYCLYKMWPLRCNE
jgi:hypothetical protein